MSRIRQIKPSWFLDKELRRGTTADAREFYIGLWMLADDDGWLAWDVERIGAELYPYDPVKRRERNVARWAELLMGLSPDTPHLVEFDCGHAWVPKMKAHQRIAGTRSETNVRAHRLCHDPRRRSGLQGATGSPGREVEIGEERNVEVGTVVAPAPEGAADATEETTEWRRRVPRELALGSRQ